MRQKKPSKENSERWLLTYSDLITLLMVLFVLLYSMSSVNTAKYKELAASLNSAMGGNTGILDKTAAMSTDSGAEASGQSGDASLPKISVDQKKEESETGTQELKLQERITEQADMNKLKTYIDAILKDYKLDSVVSTNIQVTGLVISFPDSVFFDSGKDILKDDMKTSLSQITVLLNKIDNSILVEGYTDNVPIIKGSKIASNWQLSALRAANVVEYLSESCQVNGTKLSAIGHGENHPVASNATNEGRSKNRRIVLTILYDSKEDSQQTTQQKAGQTTPTPTPIPTPTPTQTKTTTEKAIEQANK